MSNQTREEKSDPSPADAQSTEPRLPWEVRAGAGRVAGKEVGKGESPEKAPPFAEAGKIDVLARLAELRREMTRMYRDRRILKQQTADLKKRCAELEKSETNSQQESDSFRAKEAEWAKERRELLDQILELQDRCQTAESERDSAQAEIEMARTTMAEVTQALRWRDEIRPEEDDEMPLDNEGEKTREVNGPRPTASKDIPKRGKA